MARHAATDGQRHGRPLLQHRSRPPGQQAVPFIGQCSSGALSHHIPRIPDSPGLQLAAPGELGDRIEALC